MMTAILLRALAQKAALWPKKLKPELLRSIKKVAREVYDPCECLCKACLYILDTAMTPNGLKVSITCRVALQTQLRWPLPQYQCPEQSFFWGGGCLTWNFRSRASSVSPRWKITDKRPASSVLQSFASCLPPTGFTRHVRG